MNRRTTSSRWVAWLAFAALWLTLVAPTISRTLPSSMQMSAHAMPMDMAGMDHAPVAYDADHSAPAGDPLSGMDKCGYCSFFSHTPVASGSVPMLLLGAPLPARAPSSTRVQKARACSVLQVRSRGPPYSVSG